MFKPFSKQIFPYGEKDNYVRPHTFWQIDGDKLNEIYKALEARPVKKKVELENVESIIEKLDYLNSQ